MSDIPPLAERLPPDTVARLEKAAGERFTTADILRTERPLAALYLYGYSAEMCLGAAYFRFEGFQRDAIIDHRTRRSRMFEARRTESPTGGRLMSQDPHPIVGWARYLHFKRLESGDVTADDLERLNEAIVKAIAIYRHWRPDLRYKTLDVTEAQLDEVRNSVEWLLANQASL